MRTTLQRSPSGGEVAGIAPATVNGERQPVSVAAVPGSQAAGTGSGLGGPSTHEGGTATPAEPPAPTPFRSAAPSPDDDDLDVPDFLK